MQPLLERSRRVTNQPVFVDQVSNHIPLPTITHGTCEECLQQPTIQRLLHGVEDVLQEVVRLLHFVPKEQVRLAELELLQLVLLHDSDSEHVRRGEEPASSGRALVRNRCAFERNLDVEGLCISDLRGTGAEDFFGGIRGEGREGEAVL